MNVPEKPYFDASYMVLEEKYPALSDWNILTTWRGSVAHGTYVPNDDPLSIDDKDLIGIVIPPMDYYTGLLEFGSRGTQEIMVDPWDVVVYEHRKALKLLAKGNPNMLAMLWTAPEFITHITTAGNVLFANRRLFATKSAFPAFKGYAQSELQKLQKNTYSGYMGSKRKELVDKFGYDTKNASHLIRILRQGIGFMRTGDMEVYRYDADELLAIKRGEFEYAEIRAMADGLEADLKRAGEESKLPDSADWDAINALAVEMHHYQRGSL